MKLWLPKKRVFLDACHIAIILCFVTAICLLIFISVFLSVCIYSGVKIDHHLHTTQYSPSSMELYKSKDYWTLMYPMEGFYVNYASIDQNITYSPKCNYDLLLACERQRNFYYQVYVEWN